jgi:ADP-heptose:LPS heptosyltransferase
MTALKIMPQHPFHADIDPLLSMDHTAAQLVATDLVISATSAGVHLVGALGMPCWAMIPFAPDWRWTMGVDGGIRYSSMRVFCQPRPGDWQLVVQQLARRLDGVISAGRNHPIP